MRVALGILLAFSAPLLAGPDNGAITLWVQLVHATRGETVQFAGWKPIGPELNKRLSNVFRWSEYYEVAREQVSVEPGKPAKVRLSGSRDVAISFQSPTEMEVRLYRDGTLVRKAQRKVNQQMTIMGGDSNTAEAWFVVVRRDKPEAQ
ncbi:MAG TPA: hypothetical protein VMZ27_13185 [Candidatus Saccharimonadales bacterium]|nr:hypothetical protein [Candidatus Saccharimonadales bacterium]